MDRSSIGTAWTVLAGVLTLILIVAIFYSCRSGGVEHEAEYSSHSQVTVVPQTDD